MRKGNIQIHFHTDIISFIYFFEFFYFAYNNYFPDLLRTKRGKSEAKDSNLECGVDVISL